ncbi:MAG: T9SS type A sorting domain-containing protein [Candidatus Eisenbacteria bacterium]
MHTWWPHNQDPFYLFNTLDVQTRVSDYYGVDYTPAFRYDGKKINDLFGTGPNYPEFFAWLAAAVDSLEAIASPIRINMSQYPSEDWDSVYVSFDIVAVDTIIYDTTPDVYLAVTEEYHVYPPSHGHVANIDGKYAFRDMIPSIDGQVITIQKGDSLHFDWVYPINAIYNLDDIITTLWVQNDPDTSVHVGKQRNKVLQTVTAKVVSVASVSDGRLPALMRLGQNTPNPFSGTTTIAYELNRAGTVRLAVYTPTGRLVSQLVDTYREPGAYSANWNGQDRFGKSVGSGIYYYRLDTEQGSRSGRMVVLK